MPCIGSPTSPGWRGTKEACLAGEVAQYANQAQEYVNR
jgi:hypothetical protein